jgi:hypothetical protein
MARYNTERAETVGYLAFRVVPALALVMLAGLVCGAVFVRAPLVLVSDKEAHALYGEPDETFRILAASLQTRRRVKVYRVMHESDPASIAAAVAKIKPLPCAAFFPERYRLAAAAYAEANERAENTTTKTFVLLGKADAGAHVQKCYLIAPDAEVDLARTARCAAALADGTARADTKQSILFAYPAAHPPPQRDKKALEKALAAAGFAGKTVDAAANTIPPAHYAAAIIAGGGFPASNITGSAPIIIRSWAAAALFPSTVKARFDDSPYALIPSIMALPPDALKIGIVIKVPSLLNRY